MKIFQPQKQYWVFLLAICLFVFTRTNGQILDSENKINVELSDGTNVTLYGASVSLSDEKSKDYYYLPANFKLATKEDGTPQFLFLKYTSENTDEENIGGAILHMLMEYGLDKKQEKELQGILKSRHEGAVLKGVANVEPDGENSVRVISATLTNNKMTRNLVFSAKAPVMPGNKIALAADLNENGAQLLDASFNKVKSITDLSITFSYNYSVQFPAAKGYIKEDWSKLDSMNLYDSAYFSKRSTSSSYGGILGAVGSIFGIKKTKNHFTYDEMHQLYTMLEEKQVIEMNFEENLADERVAKIREAFFEYFLERFTDSESDSQPKIPGRRESYDMPNIKVGNSYKFTREMEEVIKQKRQRLFNLNYKMAVRRNFQATENLASWYDNVKDNPKCIGMVNLNDPFFKHRDVNVILDLDAEDMIGKEMNFVTVSLRKQRDAEGANDFSHQLTFDKKFFEENGNRATVTYSKAQDANPDVFEYKVQWSLRGGNVFPIGDTVWTKGSWQGITLSPPVKPVPIRFEADIDELKDLDIRNVTLQVRYMKFEKEVESNLNISLYSQQPYVEKTLYMDKNTQGYAYRLVFTHKTKGVMAMDWESKINTNYIFAVVPDELRKGNEEFIEKAIEAGKAVMGGGDGKEADESSKVLDKFKDLIFTDN